MCGKLSWLTSFAFFSQDGRCWDGSVVGTALWGTVSLQCRVGKWKVGKKRKGKGNLFWYMARWDYVDGKGNTHGLKIFDLIHVTNIAKSRNSAWESFQPVLFFVFKISTSLELIFTLALSSQENHVSANLFGFRHPDSLNLHRDLHADSNPLSSAGMSQNCTPGSGASEIQLLWIFIRKLLPIPCHATAIDTATGASCWNLKYL